MKGVTNSTTAGGSRKCLKCGKSRTHLARHYRLVHSLDIKASQELSIASRRTKGRKYRCLVGRCLATVTRLDVHAQRFHKIERQSWEYVRLMKSYRRKRRLACLESSSDDEDAAAAAQPAPAARAEANEELCRELVEALPEKIPMSEEAGKVLEKFKKDVAFAEGSTRSEKSVRQHVRQVERVWQCITRDWKLADFRDHRLVLEKWYMPTRTAGVVEPGTLKSYLCSLKMFVDFLRDHYRVVDQSYEMWREKFSKWNKGLKKPFQKRMSYLRSKDAENLLTAADISSLRGSVSYRRAKLTLEQAEGTRKGEMSASLYRDVLAYLWIELLLATGQRTLALTNLTVGEFQSAVDKTVRGELVKVVKVSDHKTAYKDVARLPVPYDLYGELEKYRRHVRSLTGRPAGVTDRFFVSWEGKCASGEINPSCMSTILNSRYAGTLSEGKKVTSRVVRKTLVSNVLETDPTKSEVLAEQMSHDVGTQRNWYNRSFSDTRSAEISHDIRHSFENLSAVRGQRRTESSCSRQAAPESLGDGDEVIIIDQVDLTDHRTRATPVKEKSRPVVKEKSVHGRRAGFTSLDLQLIDQIAQPMINGSVPVSAKTFKRLKSDFAGDTSNLDRFTTKQLYDKMRWLARKANLSRITSQEFTSALE